MRILIFSKVVKEVNERPSKAGSNWNTWKASARTTFRSRSLIVLAINKFSSNGK